MIYALTALAGFALALVAMRVVVSLLPTVDTFEKHAQLAIYCALIRTGNSEVDDAIRIAQYFKEAIEAERKASHV